MALPTVVPEEVITSDGWNDIVTAINTEQSTSGLTFETGWATNGAGFEAYVSDTTMWFLLVFERTGSALSTFAGGGDLPNQLIATLDSEFQGSITMGQAISSAAGGRVANGYYTPSDGTIRLASVAGTADLATNDTLSLGGCVRLNP